MLRRRLTRALLAGLLLGGAQAAPRVFVAYPPDGHRVAHDHVILEGSVTPGAGLTVSGQRAEVQPDGLYTLWWPLEPGPNTLTLVATQGGQSGRAVVRVTRMVPSPLPAAPTAIRAGSVQPRAPLEFWDLEGDSPAERTLRVAFEGSPGGRATFRVAGGPPQPMSEGPSGTYSAGWTVPTHARLNEAAVVVTLSGRDGQSVQATAPGRLSTTHLSSGVLSLLSPGRLNPGLLGSGPRTATQNPATVRGLGVNEARFVLTTLGGAPLLYPREGTTFSAAGRQGDDLRVRLAPGLSALVTAQQVTLGPGPVPPVLAGPLSLDAPETAAAGELRLRVALGGARPPFTLTQTQGGRRLELTLYGLGNAPTLPAAPLTDALLAGVKVDTPSPGVSRVTLDLASRQAWGFHAAYEGPDLVLSVRRPPTLDPAQPLAGRVIVLDPGHGGSNSGGAGLLGIREKGLTLPVALRAAALLRERGAAVTLTRERDEDVGLTERALIAETLGADLLVSLHHNALPDGKDPRGVRGPEVYFTHPQAEALAASLLGRLRTGLPELGVGAGLKPGADLALTRPSTQPSVLVEMAYLTDAGNVRLMHSPAGQERLAQAIADGISDFYAAQVAPVSRFQ